MVVVRGESKVDLAIQKYGVTGRGVTVVIIDRGIDWRHPDFIRADGRTRIRALLDMTGLSVCGTGGPPAIEYTEAQINAALTGGPAIGERDDVGHGTATAGAAAGNGRASSGVYRGIAPDADLLIVKAVAEAVPAHGTVPAAAGLQACLLDALDWADQKMTALRQPAVGLINSGVQWGPIDGTSVISRKIDAVFGHRRGRAYVSSSGDEGGANDHAGGTYAPDAETVVRLTSTTAAGAYMQMWYSGTAPADVTLSFDDGATVGPVAPPSTFGTCSSGSGLTVCQYAPGAEFYPWQSTSGDRAVFMFASGHVGAGTLRLRGRQAGGRFDVYGNIFNGYGDLLLGFSDHLVPGRLNDYSSTRSAIVVGDYYSGGGLWPGSSGGPTRDGRLGIDVVAPGENDIVPLAQGSSYSTLHPPGTMYTGFGATSGAGPIVVGAVALMLQLRPQLTSDEIRGVLQRTAHADRFTGAVPNPLWGYGKLDVLSALDAVASMPPARSVESDFDGDGKADITVFRPSTGTWFTTKSSGALAVQWGNASDTPVPGDYDGDGRSDVAVFRPSTGTWFIVNSSTGSVTGTQWGNANDRPVSADYDGDRRTDIAVFRPSTGTWFIVNSTTGGAIGVQWGNSADVAIPADYDGDGKADIAVFRPSTGTWFIINSSTGAVSGIQWGNSADVVVPGDYDGDGKTDVAVFRPSTGTWFIVKSSTGAVIGIQWGNSADIPVPGDFDGDGKTDVAVFRPSSGTWFIINSSTGGATSTPWGNSADIPILKRP